MRLHHLECVAWVFGAGALIAAAMVGLSSRESFEIASSDGVDHLVVTEGQSELRHLIVVNRTRRPVRFICQQGWGCDATLCTELGVSLETRLAPSETCVIPLSVVVHREGTFSRRHNLYFSDGARLWEISFEVHGVSESREAER